MNTVTIGVNSAKGSVKPYLYLALTLLLDSKIRNNTNSPSVLSTRQHERIFKTSVCSPDILESVIILVQGT